jgi:cellulose synthase/poly-beta-1,6-N-acetylglucosamine synthase-like glycosyltransferase
LIQLWLEIVLLFGIAFPIYHLINVISFLIKKRKKEKKTNQLNKDRLISILIPCNNEEKIIKHTIEGLLRLDYNHYECIFINDGSSDKTLNVIKKHLKLKKIKKKIYQLFKN